MRLNIRKTFNLLVLDNPVDPTTTAERFPAHHVRTLNGECTLRFVAGEQRIDEAAYVWKKELRLATQPEVDLLGGLVDVDTQRRPCISEFVKIHPSEHAYVRQHLAPLESAEATAARAAALRAQADELELDLKSRPAAGEAVADQATPEQMDEFIADATGGGRSHVAPHTQIPAGLPVAPNTRTKVREAIKVPTSPGFAPPKAPSTIGA